MTKTTLISIIAVISQKTRAMGYKNSLLWKIEGDLPRFRKLTTGRVVIMGRKTYESIGQPLPNRTNIVITRNLDFKLEGIIVVSSIKKALEASKKNGTEEIFIIGGGEIYAQSLSFVDRLYLTLVDDEPIADTFFPDYSKFKKEIFKEEHHEHTPAFTYLTLEK